MNKSKIVDNGLHQSAITNYCEDYVRMGGVNPFNKAVFLKRWIV